MMTLRAIIWAGLAAIYPAATFATVLEFPGNSSRSVNQTEAQGSYALPVGPWANGAIKVEPTEGTVSRQVWRLSASDLTTMQMLNPLRDQLDDAGYDVLFECETEACGGFDFRFETTVLPEPLMHIDLGDYRFLSAKRTDGGADETVSLMISKSRETGFVQLIHVGPASSPEPQINASSKTQPDAPVTADNDGFAARLETLGFAVLDDLAFETGTSTLGAGEFATLNALASYLKLNPERTVALVGHTDAVGALSTNVALSKRRAESVMAYLIANLGVDTSQLAAEGMGFLAPRGSNLTDEGREANRRVEVILTSTE